MITNNKLKAIAKINEIVDSGNWVDIKPHKSTRTNKQNSALDLFFKQMAALLNDHGMYFNYSGVLTGQTIEIPWTMELFKEMLWKPLQKALLGVTSTTRLKTSDIDVIFEVINKHFGDKGIEITFPCEFEFYLKQTQ